MNTKELRAQMVRRGLTMKEMAHKMKVSPATVSLVMRGRNPSYSFMTSAMGVLNIDKETAASIFFAEELRNA